MADAVEPMGRRLRPRKAEHPTRSPFTVHVLAHEANGAQRRLNLVLPDDMTVNELKRAIYAKHGAALNVDEVHLVFKRQNIITADDATVRVRDYLTDLAYGDTIRAHHLPPSVWDNSPSAAL